MCKEYLNEWMSTLIKIWSYDKDYNAYNQKKVGGQHIQIDRLWNLINETDDVIHIDIDINMKFLNTKYYFHNVISLAKSLML